MSFLHPSAPTNSMGQDPDPMTPARRDRARRNLATAASRNSPLQPWQDLLSWQRLSEDVFQMTPFDNLPDEQKDMIRQRRQDSFRHSSIPWVVTDATALLSFADDIDDLKKSGQFLKSYAFDPLRNLARAGPRAFGDWWRGDKISFKGICGSIDLPRQRKRNLAKLLNLDIFGFAALRFLAKLFPSWRFIALGLQFLQSTQMLFGVGISLGPIMGAILESGSRGAALLGAPFGPRTNKYNQILSARVLQRLDKGLPASAAMHPDDALDAAAAALAASNPQYVPPIILQSSDYPDFGDLLMGDASQFGNLATTAGSLPWNIGAYFVNDFLAPLLFNLSELTGGPGQTEALTPTWRAASAQLQKLTDQGTCPGPFCDAEIDHGINIFAHPLERFNSTDGHRMSKQELLKNLGWGVDGREGPFFPPPPAP